MPVARHGSVAKAPSAGYGTYVQVMETSTPKRAERKNQHYVPRFLLRNFSNNRTRISLVVLSNGHVVDSAAIRHQCSEDYFYGDNEVLEAAFAKDEAAVSRILGDLSIEHLGLLDGDSIAKLILFAYHQRGRTLGSAEAYNSMVDAFTRAAVAPTSPFVNDIALARLRDRLAQTGQLRRDDDERMRLVGAQHEAFWSSCKSLPVILDLHAKFVVTRRTPGFVISDHPVVICNQYVEHNPNLSHCSTGGMASKGLQMFFPLSPSVALAVYDPTAYQYGGKNIVCRAGPQDVARMNEMQTINAWSCVYFLPDRTPPDAVDHLIDVRRRHRSLYSLETLKSAVLEKRDGSLGQIVATRAGEIRLGAKLSFVKHRDAWRYDGYDRPFAPVRSPALLRLAERYKGELEALVKRHRRDDGTEPDSEAVFREWSAVQDKLLDEGLRALQGTMCPSPGLA